MRGENRNKIWVGQAQNRGSKGRDRVGSGRTVIGKDRIGRYVIPGVGPTTPLAALTHLHLPPPPQPPTRASHLVLASHSFLS